MNDRIPGEAADGVAAEVAADIAAQSAAPRSLDEALASMPERSLRRLRLARLAGVHALAWLLALGVFAAAESWYLLGGPLMATFLCVVSGALAGLVTGNLVHEWFHFLGARLSGGAYDIPHKLGLFVYDWKFERNDTGQFFTMSLAGTVGGLAALGLLWTTVPPQTLGRAAVFAGALGGFVFAAIIEWPVLRRVRFGGDPLTELAKIDQDVLARAFAGGALVGLLALWQLAP
ncbi:MAG: hypothetical protein CME59_09090 [Halioglobus sp.]|nr:hypothetical protein [Halioglobus sp.]MAT92744.1 hypothetical protein [Halioglobus sp.]|tara:strand:+ start:274 stop:969 length:696 start_codon:yes stop_codon:yes gene_type:complete